MADAKACFKEGGKKGIDLSGMNDLGGVKYFNVVVETPCGKMDMLEKVLQGMNQEVDETAEERRGGAGELGKMLLSAGEGDSNVLALLCFIPKALAEATPTVTADAWMDTLVEAAGGTVVSREKDGDVVKVVIAGDSAKGLFCLKMRDAAQTAGFAYLRANGLLPADDSDDDYIPDAAVRAGGCLLLAPRRRRNGPVGTVLACCLRSVHWQQGWLAVVLHRLHCTEHRAWHAFRFRQRRPPASSGKQRLWSTWRRLTGQMHWIWERSTAHQQPFPWWRRFPSVLTHALRPWVTAPQHGVCRHSTE